MEQFTSKGAKGAGVVTINKKERKISRENEQSK
jgi:hypothetical protein